MSVKSSFSLPDELHAAWKASGLTLPELVRRGLDENTVIRRVTTAEARFATADQRLAGIEHRLAQLEAAGISSVFRADDHQGDDGEWVLPAGPPTLEEIEQRRERADEMRAREWHRLLLRRSEPCKNGQRVLTTVTAAAAFRASTNAARDRMHTLAAFGLAQFLDDGEVPYRWLVRDDQGTEEEEEEQQQQQVNAPASGDEP
jgi:hypothetical protein